MKKVAWWIVLVLGLGGAAVAGQTLYNNGGTITQVFPRFHRYAMTRLDDTTTLDMVKDGKTGICRLVYRVDRSTRGIYASLDASAVTYLGEVPCNPIPVPPKVGDAPPSSPIR